jgi:hypothetical protein
MGEGEGVERWLFLVWGKESAIREANVTCWSASLFGYILTQLGALVYDKSTPTRIQHTVKTNAGKEKCSPSPIHSVR